MKTRILLMGLCISLFLSACVSNAHGNSASALNVQETRSIAESHTGLAVGYYAAAYVEDAFLAAGTNGRLDRIGFDKQIQPLSVPTTEDLTGIWTDGMTTLVCGTNATLLYSADGQSYSKAQVDVSTTIFGVTVFNGTYLACAQGGKILQSEDGKTWASRQLDTEHDIISIGANEKYVMAITKESDILISQDGVEWKAENFNEVYAEYYPAYLFTSIRNMGSSFFIVGQSLDDPGSPFAMFSETGDVWIFRSLSEINGKEPMEFFPLTINAVGHNLDQIIAVCNKGRLLTITECSVCNEMSQFGEADLYDLAFGDGKLLVVGAGFVFDLIDDTQVRQYKIKPEQAYADYYNNNAVIIDVRTDEEYNGEHILGSIHIPVDEIAEKLPEIVPDLETELIFYCAAGKRAQTALETAVGLGYQVAYNLGGIGDWIYETETGPAA